jgi:hypothetical protein
MSRILATLLVLSTLGMIAWYAYWVIPQTRMTPDSGRFVLLFFGGLALPYLVTLGQLTRRDGRDGRDGLRFALGASIVNAIWALPLGTVLALFAGFALGNRDQLQQVAAVVIGAVLQALLLAVAGTGLWRGRAMGAPAPHAWAWAFAIPVLCAVTSWSYFEWQVKAFKAIGEQAERNDRAAQETVKMLQACLAIYRERGYPARLDTCREAAVRTGEASGYRFEYLPALADARGRRGAYLLCARPLRFRATGFNTIVADGLEIFGVGVGAESTPDNPPTCASVLGMERAVAWCVYQRAAREPAQGYPARLADIAPCVSERRVLHQIGEDGLKTEEGQMYAYLADAPDASGRISRYRVYRLDAPGGAPVWMDEQLQQGKFREKAGPAVEGLPANAEPERFEPGCAADRGEDCFLAGCEWQRKAFQVAGKETESPAVELNHAAVKAFERGCALDHGRSCVWLGQEVDRGVHAERDVVRAASLFEKGCMLGDRSGCRYAADMHETGRKARPQMLNPPPAPPVPKPDLPRDVPRAIALYERACEIGERESCLTAARLLEAGEGIAPDREKALALFTQMCDDGMALACARAAALAPGREADYLRRACVLGGTGNCAAAGSTMMTP